MAWRVFREGRCKMCQSNTLCRTGRKTNILLLVRILQKTHFPPYGLAHTLSLFLRNTCTREFELKYPKFILADILHLSLFYFWKILEVNLKIRSVKSSPTHNRSGGLLADASFILTLCISLMSSHINLHNIMHVVKPTESCMLSEK